MNIFRKLFGSLSRLTSDVQASRLKIPNIWSEINHVENFGETQMMRMEDGNIIFLSVGLDTTKVFVAANLESLSSFIELASFPITPTSQDRRKSGDAILNQLRKAIAWPKTIDELKQNIRKMNQKPPSPPVNDEKEELYEFGRINRIKEMNKSWLTRKITAEQEEAYYLRARELRPGDRFAIHLREFLAHRQDGDELWEFGTSDESWKMMAGRKGIAMVRNGEIFDGMTTRMN